MGSNINNSFLQQKQNLPKISFCSMSKVNQPFKSIFSTPENEKLISDLLNKGKKRKEIAEILNCSVTTVSNLINKFGLNTVKKNRKPQNREWNKEERELVLQFFRENKTPKKISELFMCSENEITDILKNFGIITEKVKTQDELKNDFICQMRKQGKTFREISSLLKTQDFVNFCNKFAQNVTKRN